MTILDKIKRFLSETQDISFGYNEINFVLLDRIEEEQIGYSVDAYRNSLIIGNDGDWREEWLVIASNQLGDPERQDVLTKIERQNSDAELWYWENYFENG
jgi:hypothetical protein